MSAFTDVVAAQEVDGGKGVGEPPAQVAAPATGYAARGPLEVITQLNVGVGFESAGVDDTALCELLVPLLTNGEATPEQLRDFIKYPANLRPKLYTVYRPKTLAAGTVYPVVVWGNGTCSSPLVYEPLLGHLASHGFVVIAPNSRAVGDGESLVLAINYLAKQNNTPSSPFYRKLDLTRIGAAGHSQGGEATIRVAADPRITSLLPIETSQPPEPTKQTFFLAGGEDNVITPEMVKEAYDAFTGPAVYGLATKVDHVSPIAEAPLLQAAVTAWFKETITSDPAAKGQFTGGCTFCSTPDWTVERKNLP